MQLIDQSFEQQPVPHTSTPEDNHIAAVFLFYLRHPARCLGPGGASIVFVKLLEQVVLGEIRRTCRL